MMELHLDSRSEELIELQLRSGRYTSAEEVVRRALEALPEVPAPDRRQAVRDMAEFAEQHGFTLGTGVRVRELIHEGHKY